MEQNDSVFVRVDRFTGIPGLKEGLFGTVSQTAPRWVRVHLENGYKETFTNEEVTVLPPESNELRKAIFERCKQLGLDMLNPTPTTALRRLIRERTPKLKSTPFDELTIIDWRAIYDALREPTAPKPKVFIKDGRMVMRLGR